MLLHTTISQSGWQPPWGAQNQVRGGTKYEVGLAVKRQRKVNKIYINILLKKGWKQAFFPLIWQEWGRWKIFFLQRRAWQRKCENHWSTAYSVSERKSVDCPCSLMRPSTFSHYFPMSNRLKWKECNYNANWTRATYVQLVVGVFMRAANYKKTGPVRRRKRATTINLRNNNGCFTSERVLLKRTVSNHRLPPPSPPRCNPVR